MSSFEIVHSSSSTQQNTRCHCTSICHTLLHCDFLELCSFIRSLLVCRSALKSLNFFFCCTCTLEVKVGCGDGGGGGGGLLRAEARQSFRWWSQRFILDILSQKLHEIEKKFSEKIPCVLSLLDPHLSLLDTVSN